MDGGLSGMVHALLLGTPARHAAPLAPETNTRTGSKDTMENLLNRPLRHVRVQQQPKLKKGALGHCKVQCCKIQHCK